MAVSVVTSCSLVGWKQYGLKCMNTLFHHWPSEVIVHLVSEETLPLHEISKSVLGRHQFQFWPLMTDPSAREFYTAHANDKGCRGMRTGKYNFRQDAWRFSKKVFAINMIAPKSAGRLIWLDADTITLEPVPLEMLERMPPEEHGIAYLARPGYHSECGWIGYNLEIPGVRQFIARFAALYQTGEVFKLGEWHDSWVFDWLRKRMPEVTSWPIPHKNSGHPFVYSELGKYMDHLKGARKASGVSVEHPRYQRRKG